MDIVNPPSRVQMLRGAIDPTVLRQCSMLRRSVAATTALAALTAFSGAFVAGNDAGRAYNTFPKMGHEWIPSDIFQLQPWYRNFFEDTATVQLDHRVLAMSTLIGCVAILCPLTVGSCPRRHWQDEDLCGSSYRMPRKEQFSARSWLPPVKSHWGLLRCSTTCRLIWPWPIRRVLWRCSPLCCGLCTRLDSPE